MCIIFSQFEPKPLLCALVLMLLSKHWTSFFIAQSFSFFAFHDFLASCKCHQQFEFASDSLNIFCQFWKMFSIYARVISIVYRGSEMMCLWKVAFTTW